jgi:hypothetical protein
MVVGFQCYVDASDWLDAPRWFSMLRTVEESGKPAVSDVRYAPELNRGVNRAPRACEKVPPPRRCLLWWDPIGQPPSVSGLCLLSLEICSGAECS